MRPLSIASLLSFATASAACGGALDPGAGNSAGSGTSTLLVEGAATADADLPDARDAASFTTHFDFHIEKGGTPITTGTVTVTSNGGKVALAFVADGQGHWTGDQAGYEEVYQLDVTSGSDAVTGVRVDGPDIHTFTAPTLGATVDSTVPLAMSWSRGEHADTAVLSTHQLDHVTIDDSGSYSLAAGSLKSSKDQTQAETIELRRADQVVPAGATAGSSVTVEIRNHIDVVVAINPNA